MCQYVLVSAGATPQRAAQAAHIAQLEESLANLQTQHEQLQAEMASQGAAKQASEQKVAQAMSEAAQAGRRAQEAELMLENQSKELAFLQARSLDGGGVASRCITAADMVHANVCDASHVCSLDSTSGVLT